MKPYARRKGNEWQYSFAWLVVIIKHMDVNARLSPCPQTREWCRHRHVHEREHVPKSAKIFASTCIHRLSTHVPLQTRLLRPLNMRPTMSLIRKCRCDSVDIHIQLHTLYTSHALPVEHSASLITHLHIQMRICIHVYMHIYVIGHAHTHSNTHTHTRARARADTITHIQIPIDNRHAIHVRTHT